MKNQKTQDAPSVAVDEFHGQGGSYVLDAATGKRRLVERTNSVPDENPQPAAGAAPDQE